MSRRGLAWAVLWCLGAAACSRHGKVASGVIGIEQMSAILTDMQMASAFNDSYVPDTVRPTIEGREYRLKVFYQQVLDLHHTDRQDFLKSYEFYESHPDLLKKVYARMGEIVERKTAVLDSLTRPRLVAPTELPRTLMPGTGAKDFSSIYQAVADSIHHQASRVFNPYLFD